MSTAQKHSVNMAELAAALGTNVVRFVPPSRDEPEVAPSEWAASLDLIDQAASFFKATEQRASQAEERSEKVAVKAIEGLRAAQQRVEHAEAQVRRIEEEAAEEVRAAWAQEAEERARTAESRVEAAEARAREAEEWLQRLTGALRQKLAFGGAPAEAEHALLRRTG
jgi:hypothetical protein